MLNVESAKKIYKHSHTIHGNGTHLPDIWLKNGTFRILQIRKNPMPFQDIGVVHFSGEVGVAALMER